MCIRSCSCPPSLFHSQVDQLRKYAVWNAVAVVRRPFK